MKTLIIYATKHGCTEKCASKLKDRIDGEIDLVNVRNSSEIDLTNYDTIIIGGSIHAGKIQKKIKNLCRDSLKTLKEKRIGLFLCCMEEGETARNQFNEVFPEELIKHATATGIFGGEFNLEKMNFIERGIVKKIAHVNKSASKIDQEAINKFIVQMS